MEAAQQVQEREDQKSRICQSLIPQVEEMTKNDRGVTILEVNNTSTGGTYDGNLDCYASVITSRGNASLKYSVFKSPQGSPMINVHLDFSQ
jgi:hypothetical protein